MIPLLGFAPDLDPTTPGIITDCTNFVPTLKGYKGGYSGADVGMDAVASAVLNGAVLTKLDASNRLIVGTTEYLYESSGSSWSDVSGTTYNASSAFPWHFAQFGDTSLAVNKGDTLQYSTSGAFADVTGAPKAGAICTSSGFVMLANTNEAIYGDSPDRWWCSALYDVSDWTPDIATQCTTGRLVDTPGAINGVKSVGNDSIVAYKEKSMYLGQYVGPSAVWQWTLISDVIGCSTQDAVINIGIEHIFIGYDDIYIYQPGGLPTPIGAPLKEWFFADLHPGYRHKIKGLYDRKNSVVYFFYPRISDGGNIDGCISYNHKTNKWGLAHRNIEAVVEYITGGYTWDTLPITTWDSWPAIPYDSPFWTATSETLAYIGTDHKIYSLTGKSSASSFTTGDVGDDQAYSLISRVRLRYLVAPDSATLTNYYQDQHGISWIEDTITSEISGRFDLLKSARWHKGKIDFTGDVEISAMDAVLTKDGEE